MLVKSLSIDKLIESLLSVQNCGGYCENIMDKICLDLCQETILNQPPTYFPSIAMHDESPFSCYGRPASSIQSYRNWEEVNEELSRWQHLPDRFYVRPRQIRAAAAEHIFIGK